jgi:hypothetical protein
MPKVTLRATGLSKANSSAFLTDICYMLPGVTNGISSFLGDETGAAPLLFLMLNMV